MLSFCFTIAAQNKNVKHRTDNVFIPGWAGTYAMTTGTFDYDYYENQTGDYVKHGSFKVYGKRAFEKIVQRQRIIITQTYTATGNYVDGWLDGVITIQDYTTENDVTISSLIISAGYKNGLPNGVWSVKENGITTLKCHFSDGMMTGNYETTRGYVNGNELNKVVTGQFDKDGKYDGTWHVEQVFAIEDFEFIHGVLYRYILRETDGTVKNKQDQERIQPDKVKNIAQLLYDTQLTADSLVNIGYAFRTEDKINAERAIEDLLSGNTKYGFELFGGQKSTLKQSFLPIILPQNYLYIYPEHSVPDKYMSFIYNDWEKTLKDYEQGNLSRDDSISLFRNGSIYQFSIRMGNRSLYYCQHGRKLDYDGVIKYYLPHENTEVLIYDDPYTDTYPVEKYFISIKQASKLNEYVDRLKELKMEKDRIDENSKQLSKKENALKLRFPQYYMQYEKINGKTSLKEASNEDLFFDRIKCIDNYMDFASVMDSINNSICPRIIKKAEGLPVFENVSIYINSLDKSISCATSEEDIDRIKENVRVLKLYEKVATLQTNYYTKKEQITFKVCDYKHIGLAFQSYCAAISIPNDISYDSIAFLKSVVRKMDNILKVLNNNDLKIFDKQIKALKKDQEAQYQTLIGSNHNDEIIDDLNELIEEFGPESYEDNTEEYLSECESACDDFIRIQSEIKQGKISSDSEEAFDLEILWKTINSTYEELETMKHNFSEEQLIRFNTIQEKYDIIIKSFE